MSPILSRALVALAEKIRTTGAKEREHAEKQKKHNLSRQLVSKPLVASFSHVETTQCRILYFFGNCKQCQIGAGVMPVYLFFPNGERHIWISQHYIPYLLISWDAQSTAGHFADGNVCLQNSKTLKPRHRSFDRQLSATFIACSHNCDQDACTWYHSLQIS